MNIRIRLLFIACILYSLMSSAQVYTETKTGANTWGGPYVPPVWTKSYDMTLKTYNINVKPATSQVTPNTGGGSSISGYVKKSKWNIGSFSSIDYERDLAREQYRDTKAREAAVEYGKQLDQAILYFNAGAYLICYNIITRILPLISRKEVKENDNSDELYGHLAKFYKVVQYYEYMSKVKVGVSDNAMLLYNLMFNPVDKSSYSVAEISKPFPYTSQFYYFLDSASAHPKPDLAQYSVKQRFLADLFFIELLADLNKKSEGRHLLRSIINYYLPKIDSMEAFIPQIALDHFYLGNVEEAESLLEYYWNESESYDARLNILNELVVGDGRVRKNNWSKATHPKEYAFVKKNYQFLDSVVRSRNLQVSVYSDDVKYALMVDRGNELDEYMAILEPTISKPFDSLYYSARYKNYSTYNRFVERYLMVLLRKGDKDQIRATLRKVFDVSQKSKILTQAMLDTSNYKEQFNKFPALYWEVYYREKSQPASNSILFFVMKDFADAGGKKYLMEAAKPYMDELSNYTEKEAGFSVGDLEQCGIMPDYQKKKRNYPSEVPSAIAEANAAMAKADAAKVKIEQDKIAAIDERAREIRETPLTKEEETYKKMGTPLGALAMFEHWVKSNKVPNESLFDSLSMDFANACFQRVGYAPGKSMRADILMASIVCEREKIGGFLQSWTQEQAALHFYKKPITADDQTPAPEEAPYEEQYVMLLSRAGKYEQLGAYVGKTWATALAYPIQFAEALAMAGKFDEAMNFIQNFERKTFSASVLNPYRGYEAIMTGIVLFHKKDYKKSWEFLNGSKVPNNQRSDPEGKWKFPSQLYVPSIFTTQYGHYYFCCAKEVRKKDFSEFLQVTSLPQSAPVFMEQKYKGIFTVTQNH
ncbi:MAG TPA: hypothetical protein VK166_12330 [Chitinophagaceae bacterium]|nr:hypothetical protein [Chitinophagaceae bacterium]